jgi:hypothetical protein
MSTFCYKFFYFVAKCYRGEDQTLEMDREVGGGEGAGLWSLQEGGSLQNWHAKKMASAEVELLEI